MTLKEQILQELDRLPEESLATVLAFLQSLPNDRSAAATDEEVWQAYLVSKHERREVYRRLADS
jgi:hypothetical protein